jgi:type II secretory pathway pseudopilin PulG
VSARVGRDEGGFGLVELVIAIAVLNVVILALFATFNAGSLSLQRASRISTAETIADKQMELYRAQLNSGIGLQSGLVTAAGTDSTHTGDAAWVSAGAQYTDDAETGCTGSLDECKPVQTGVSGPDGRSYRIDTYVRELSSGAGGPTSGRDVKRVTVVVRAEKDGKLLARLSSTFDQATGCLGTLAEPC